MSEEQKKEIIASMMEDAIKLYEKYEQYIPDGGFLDVYCWKNGNMSATISSSEKDEYTRLYNGFISPEWDGIYYGTD